MNYEIKSPQQANIQEIFFNKNTNRLSYKNNYGIVTPIDEEEKTSEFNVLSWSAKKGNIVTGSIGTGISDFVKIPQGTLDSSNCLIEVMCGAYKQAGSLTMQLVIYCNTENSLTGATLLGTHYNFNTNDIYGKTVRTLVINDNTLTVHPTPTTLIGFDFSSPAAGSVIPFDNTTSDFYLLFAINNLAADNIGYTTMHKVLTYSK
jgi:hypothetical protein